MDFIDKLFNKKLLDVIQTIFPNLIRQHQDLLLKYLVGIIEFISIKFNFNLEDKESYVHQFMQNNYRDLRGLLLMLLPYINDDTGEKIKKLESLNDLYTKKVIDCDINVNAPIYEYTNLQYGRCKIEKKGHEKIATEIQFDKKHLEDNYELLKATIKFVANKLYVNWINIRPFNRNYTQTKLFNDTNKLLYTAKLDFDNENCIETGEIYNILSNYVYADIVDIRWIIYDIHETINENKKLFKFTYILNLLIDISNCIKNINWIMLNKEQHNEFSNNWEALVDAYVNNTSLKNISYNNIELIMVAIMSYGKSHFVKYVNDEHKSAFDIIILDDDIDIISDENRQNLITNTKHILSTINIDPKIVYDYFSWCFSKLSKTWYSSYYLTYNKDMNYYELDTEPTSLISSNDKNFRENKNVTIKYLYNYAKSLCIIETNDDNDETKKIKKKELYPSQWKSNTLETKLQIIKRLNDKDGTWFNIKGILGRRNVPYNKLWEMNSEIYRYIREHLIHVIFIVLLNSGLLTEFVPDKKLSDHKLLPNGTKERRSEIIKRVGTEVLNGPHKENYKNSINFIDNLSHDNHVFINKNIKKLYLDTLLEGNGSWMVTYTMDWISQINTFHHYLNNRIMYVTGGTGQGKSTEMPKLLLYALKMCDYKINGFIACTAPRINVVTGNSDYISSELGVPILKDNDTLSSKFKTKNYHVQYRYKEDKHANDKLFGLKLQIMTDGILDTKLNNPLLKKQSIELNESGIEEKKFGVDNIYDIIIVDEAHEHNVYIDLILTKIRYPLYFNNDIKLLIVSATMIADDPIYRRYYRMINDNRMYPLNMSLKDRNIDRINMDRVIYLSPPGEVTQFRVDETYLDKKELAKVDEYRAENIVLKILNEPGKDILLFQPGIKEINRSITYINSHTVEKKNVIAIPYYSDLKPDEKKKFVENIDDTNKVNIPFKKVMIDNTKKENELDKKEKIEETSNESNSYDRIIIVGTDIAEASITINTLTHVVDTGMQKIKNFKPFVRTSILEKQKISDSSRVQRKGRVGRVGPGSVYYTYEEDSREKRRPYKIAISDISDNLFDLLCEYSHHKNEHYELFNKDTDINNSHNKIKMCEKDKIGKDKSCSYILGIDDIIKNQYYITNNFYDYYGRVYHWDEMPICYVDGYGINTLNDFRGIFYIIHPDELSLERNIIGKIVRVVDPDSGDFTDGINFKSYKIRIFWDMMKENLFIVSQGNVFYKTEFGKKLFDLKEHVPEFDNNNIMLEYIYSVKYNCSDDMQKLISIIGSSCETSIGNIIDIKQYDSAMSLYGNKYSDIYAIIEIFNFVIKWYDMMYSKLGLDENIMTIEDIKQKEWIVQKELFLEKLKSEDFSDIDPEYIKPLLSLYSLDKLTAPDSELNYDEIKALKSFDVIKHNIEKINNSKYIKNLKMICDKKYLQYDKIIDLYKNYRKFQFLLKTKIINGKIIEIEKLTPKIYDSNDKYESLLFCLIQGNQYNLLKRIARSETEHFFVNLLYPSIRNVYQLKKISKYKKTNETLIKDEYISDTILYLCKKTDENDEESINFIANIDTKVIAKLLPLICNHKRNNVTKGIISKNNYDLEIKKYLQTFLNIPNILKYNIINNYSKSLIDVMYEFINNYDKNNIDKLYVIFGKKNPHFAKIKNILIADEIEYKVEMIGGNNSINNYNFINYGGNYNFAKYLLKWYN